MLSILIIKIIKNIRKSQGINFVECFIALCSLGIFQGSYRFGIVITIPPDKRLIRNILNTV